MDEKVKDAVDVLCAALKSDPGYWQAWKSNIAVAFIDAYPRGKKVFTVHAIANKAAENFLNLLCATRRE